MKAEYMQVFSTAVVGKVKAAEAIGSKTTWTTKDHLTALSKLLSGVDQAKAFDILEECYNISGFQQSLEKVKMYKEAGHFQRSKGKESLSSIEASLIAATTPVVAPAAPATPPTQG